MRLRRLGPFAGARPAARAWLVVAIVLGLSGCGAGGGGESATRSTTERSGTRTAPSVSDTAPTRPTRTDAATSTPTEPATTAERTTSPPTEPPTSAERTTSSPTEPATSAAGTPAAAESQGLGALGWVLLILLAAGLVAGWLIWRSRRKSAWDTQAEALEADTRAITSIQLPAVLTAETAGQRALSWPPLRAAVVDLTRRWDLQAGQAPDDQRQARSARVRSLLQELLAAVDAENQALAADRDWRLLRPRVDQARQALAAELAGVGQPASSPAGDPWPPAPGG